MSKQAVNKVGDKVTISSTAVDQETQKSLNGMNGVVIKVIDSNNIIVKLSNGKSLPFASTELKVIS